MASGELKRQMGVALPDDLREQLQRAADTAGHSVAAEIRQRVERTFSEDAIDPVMRDLFAAAVELANNVQVDFGGASWRSDASVHAAFAAGVARFLSALKPEGHAVARGGGAVSSLLGVNTSSADHDQPEAIGQTHARYLLRNDAYPHLKAAVAALSPPARAARHIRKKEDKS